ncbi:uncharacterized protein LOC124276335 [Haliotis rubra]|uniref:uncharacterized protein LOC124276335 n=1 Tax=Haliotis rubra TaxID=36100 RepID=UPI001EE5ACF5|nr:uncharacterized protein LOC124276335 [Haliotis rubra]
MAAARDIVLLTLHVNKTCNANCPKNCHFETCSCLTSSSPDTTSATPSSPKQGGILAVYWICFNVNSMYLVIFIIFIVYGYEKKLWTSLNYFCQSNEPDRVSAGAPLSGECEETPDQVISTPGDRIRAYEANTGSRTTKNSCCNLVQSIGKARALALALVCGYVLLYIITVCVIHYHNI